MSVPYLASAVLMTVVLASAPNVSLASTLPVIGAVASSVTEATSSSAVGSVSMIWMTRSLLLLTPARSVTTTGKLSRTALSPPLWSSAPPVSW